MRKMKITLHKDGTQKVEVLEAQGDNCQAFTAQVERRLGTQDGERVLKPEFYANESEIEIERQHEAAS